jgi:multidrug resistance efflux pump
MAFWNRRSVRITVGILLLVAGGMAILPAVTGYTSLDGTVNARIAIISAPIDGTVTSTPPKIGVSLPAGAELLGIRNDRVPRAAEVQMEAELEAAKERLLGIEEQRAQLTALRQELQARRQEH